MGVTSSAAMENKEAAVGFGEVIVCTNRQRLCLLEGNVRLRSLCLLSVESKTILSGVLR